MMPGWTTSIAVPSLMNGRRHTLSSNPIQMAHHDAPESLTRRKLAIGVTTAGKGWPSIRDDPVVEDKSDDIDTSLEAHAVTR